MKKNEQQRVTYRGVKYSLAKKDVPLGALRRGPLKLISETQNEVEVGIALDRLVRVLLDPVLVRAVAPRGLIRIRIKKTELVRWGQRLAKQLR